MCGTTMSAQVYTLYDEHITKKTIGHSWVVPTDWINKVVCPLPTWKLFIVTGTSDHNIVLADGTPDKNLRHITHGGRGMNNSVKLCVLRLFSILFHQCLDVFYNILPILQRNTISFLGYNATGPNKKQINCKCNKISFREWVFYSIHSNSWTTFISVEVSFYFLIRFSLSAVSITLIKLPRHLKTWFSHRFGWLRLHWHNAQYYNGTKLISISSKVLLWQLQRNWDKTLTLTGNSAKKNSCSCSIIEMINNLWTISEMSNMRIFPSSVFCLP